MVEGGEDEVTPGYRGWPGVVRGQKSVEREKGGGLCTKNWWRERSRKEKLGGIAEETHPHSKASPRTSSKGYCWGRGLEKRKKNGPRCRIVKKDRWKPKKRGGGGSRKKSAFGLEGKKLGGKRAKTKKRGPTWEAAVRTRGRGQGNKRRKNS